MKRENKIVLSLIAAYIIYSIASSVLQPLKFGSIYDADTAIQKFILSGKNPSICKGITLGAFSYPATTESAIEHCVIQFAKAKSDPTICRQLAVEDASYCLRAVDKHISENQPKDGQSVTNLIEGTRSIQKPN